MLSESISTVWIPTVVLVAGVGARLFAGTSTTLELVYLSYEIPNRRYGSGHEMALDSVMYGKGKRDIAFVALWTGLLLAFRQWIMISKFLPLAKHLKIPSSAKQARFAEQLYMAGFAVFFSVYGLLVMSRTPVWFFNTREFYATYPHKTLSADFKFFYLLQAAYWGHQLLVLLLRLEKPRKDIYQLTVHHLTTVALVILSYRFHFTHIGLAVFVTHDITEFLLASSKLLNYLDSILTAPVFATSICTWIYFRNYMNMVIIRSVLTELRTIGPWGWNTEKEEYKGPLAQNLTFSLLAVLQVLNLYWLGLKLRIGKRFVMDGVKKDDRSDEE